MVDRNTKITAGIVGGSLVLFLGIGVSLDNNEQQSGEEAPNPPATSSQPKEKAPEPKPEPKKAPEPKTYTSGTYEVGTDIKPGKYYTEGPSKEAFAAEMGCYWARLHDVKGKMESIIANGFTGPGYVRVQPSDGYVEFGSGGCTWEKMS